MKKKSQPSDLEKLDAPVRLTPEQLELVAAGFAKQVKVTDIIKDKLVLTGARPVEPVIKF